MIRRKIIVFLSIAFIVIFFAECKKKSKKDEPNPDASFDKAGMLSNIGESVIIPSYADLKIAVDSLQYFSVLFAANPSLTTLMSFQSHFLQAYSHYQHVSTFEFGPADNELMRANFNTFPCDTAQINSKIAVGDNNLSTVADLDAKGFPALDFLLYGNAQDNNYVLIKFSTDVNATNAKNYLTALVNEL